MMDWRGICRVTKLGTDLGSQHAQIITLPDPLDTSYATYQTCEERLVINLLPPFRQNGILLPSP
jgi:hypothetical protein